MTGSAHQLTLVVLQCQLGVSQPIQSADIRSEEVDTRLGGRTRLKMTVLFIGLELVVCVLFLVKLVDGGLQGVLQ